MLRPLLAFSTLAVAAFILHPTVAGVGEGVEALNIMREMPWSLWKWGETPPPENIVDPYCDNEKRAMESEVTKWPDRISKNVSFELSGYVREIGTKKGQPDIVVDLFLNETKTAPGMFLGTTTTTSGGNFTLETRIPSPLAATQYHLVAHSHEKRIGCHLYEESWSDPEMDVTAKTRLHLELPDEVVVGTELVVQGRLVDEVGAAVRNANVTLEIDGHRVVVRTDSSGRFVHRSNVTEEDEIHVLAKYAGNAYYGGSSSEGDVDVVPEDVRIDDLRLVRSEERTLTGRIFLPPGELRGNATLRFSGIEVAACRACEPKASLPVDPGADGTFSATVFVPPTEAPGPFNVTVQGAGLRQGHAHAGTLRVPVTAILEAEARSPISKSYEGHVRLVDDAGDAVRGEVVFVGPGEPQSGVTDAAGRFAIQGAGACGPHPMHAIYAGDGTHVGARKEGTLELCPAIAFLPAWILDAPPWLWPVLLVLVAILLAAARALRARYAPAISRGPPVEIRVTEPRDIAPDVVSIGETVRLTAFLEDPLPQGHSLRMGTHRAMEEKLVADDLRATHDLTPEKLGTLAVRAEIVDARGRVVTRRTAHVRVVKYAAEVERRYRSLKATSAGDDADVVTPREFESWLRGRAPELDASLTRRLVGIFEEADYGPRETGREEFLAYLEAEMGLEVRRNAA